LPTSSHRPRIQEYYFAVGSGALVKLVESVTGLSQEMMSATINGVAVTP
jgi:hypothetical protein